MRKKRFRELSNFPKVTSCRIVEPGFGPLRTDLKVLIFTITFHCHSSMSSSKHILFCSNFSEQFVTIVSTFFFLFSKITHKFLLLQAVSHSGKIYLLPICKTSVILPVFHLPNEPILKVWDFSWTMKTSFLFRETWKKISISIVFLCKHFVLSIKFLSEIIIRHFTK